MANVFVWINEEKAVVCEENQRKAVDLAKKYGVELKGDADFVIYDSNVGVGMIAPQFGGTLKLKGSGWTIDISLEKQDVAKL